MKKTLIALAVTAFAASATAKVDLVNQDGTSVSIDGRVKIVAHKEAIKEKGKKSDNKHSHLSNDGSRLGLTAKHNISDDFYALGRLEFRIDKGDKNASNIGTVDARRAYVGLGHKDYGEVTFGKQLLIGDSIGRIGLDNYYNVGSAYGLAGGWTILNEVADSAVSYTYTGVKGLTVGADYSFATEHETGGAAKNGYGVGAVYAFEAGQGTASVSLGYAHSDFETSARKLSADKYSKNELGQYVLDTNGEHIVLNKGNPYKDQDGVYGGFNYVIDGLKFGVDGGYSVKKGKDDKQKLHYVRTGARYDIPNTQVGVYGNYSYLTVKSEATGQKATTNRAHQYLVGTDYSFHKNVKVFVEGKLGKVRYDNNSNKPKATDKGIATGLVVFW